eukprot:CAMPEP_0170522266 /NCGR_PEP_ID=MMETSP0209-20121228/7716_1 /TAXON_ID=665100 ORGANISM="Litonotus pictus, Strain P1" /NCGR_SAMPLE_ID=MMETSP0209 /ASSEMBLY_ACC=CAM_ASM_000301 /LENGTH=1258 /DNA_ID=CAMNT_0010809697 /DNA_START=167 /DNA_END=3940 /DNA_ORIENTATION=-
MSTTSNINDKRQDEGVQCLSMPNFPQKNMEELLFDVNLKDVVLTTTKEVTNKKNNIGVEEGEGEEENIEQMDPHEVLDLFKENSEYTNLYSNTQNNRKETRNIDKDIQKINMLSEEEERRGDNKVPNERNISKGRLNPHKDEKKPIPSSKSDFEYKNEGSKYYRERTNHDRNTRSNDRKRGRLEDKDRYSDRKRERSRDQESSYVVEKEKERDNNRKKTENRNTERRRKKILYFQDIQINEEYMGIVTKTFSTGCEVAFQNSHGLEGYCRFMSRKKINELPEDKVTLGKHVKVRVFKIVESRIYLYIIELINERTKELIWKEESNYNYNKSFKAPDKPEVSKEALDKLNKHTNLVDLNNLDYYTKNSTGNSVKNESLFEGSRNPSSIKTVQSKTLSFNTYNLNQSNTNRINNVLSSSQPKIGELTGIILDTHEEDLSKEKRNRIGSPEMWELKQLGMANSIDPNENPFYDKEEGNMPINNIDKEIEVEIKEDEAPFLRGKTTKTGIHYSPVKIVGMHDGTLHRSAVNQSELAKGRRELREQQHRNLLENIPKELLGIDDSKMAYNSKSLVNTIKEITNNSYEPLEWKREGVIKKFYTTTRSQSTIKEKRSLLPIYKLRNELLEEIDSRNVLIVIGETGSGKTTQITQYLYEHGYHKRGKIGCTQPRRVAAMSVAKRVAEEFGCKLGEEVGYSIRFEDCCSEKTIIKYMTDGMLLREALIDKNLSGYSVIMLDEAHERTIHTDILFGLLKQALKVRKDLKLIVTSATLDAEHFSNFFDKCEIFRIPGRTFHVDVFYSKESEPDYLDAALITVMQIHLTEPKGDILVFLTGQEEIDTACQLLHDRMKALGEDAPPLMVLPVYSALPSEMQTKIFEPAPDGTRKCVIATNIAEASLTIDGIYYVIDPGFAKLKAYNPKTGMDSLVVVPISQSSAIQRAGRAGRTGPGKCYRLYTREAFITEMKETAVPEIQRTNLANTVLLLKAMGINDLMNFEFMDAPPTQTLVSAMEQLFYLGALDEEGLLTKLGRRMAEFPLEPQLSKMLLTSIDLTCSDEIITIVSMLSVQNIFFRPREKQQLADTKRTKFYHCDGDHLTLLTVYQMWEANKFSNPWCYENFIQSRAMKKAYDIRKQLVAIMDRYKLSIGKCNKDYARVRKAIASGFFAHIAKKDNTEGYKTLLDNQTVYIHPSSALFNKSPEWVVYHELVLTSKEYMREVCSIDPRWLVDVAPRYFKYSDPNYLSKRKKNEKIEPLHNKYEEPNSW